MAHSDLARILRDYGISIDSAALKSAFSEEDQGRLLSEWARVHLTPDTLLSKEELNAYSVLERSGKAEKLAADTDLAVVQAVNDQDVKDAIDDLNRSTEAIAKQTETLRQQQDALERLVTNESKTSDSRNILELKQGHKWETDHNSLSAAVEILSQGLVYRISELEQQSKGSGGDVHKTVDEMLHSDDRLLTSLQKLSWELDTEDPEEKESVRKLRDICAKIIKYTVECIRTKLDRLYLESIQSFISTKDNDRVPQDEVKALQEELESLYSEILPVAQMSVEQQYLEPSLRSLSAKDDQSLNRTAEAVDYILECLDYLLYNVERLSSRVAAFKAHETATRALTGTARAELSAPVTSPIKSRRTTVTESPVRRRNKPSVGADGTTSSSAQRRRRSSGADVGDAPLEQLLGELALVLPDAEDVDMNGTNVKAQVEFLSSALRERSDKAAGVARNVQESFEAAASSRLVDAGRALQLVRDSVLAESPYGEINLVDAGIEGSIAVLAQEVHFVTSRLAGAEREMAVVTRGRNIRKEELIGRWGR